MRKILLILLFTFSIVAAAESYETNVHQAITSQAVTASGTDSVLKTMLGITSLDKYNNSTAIEWMESGSDTEDNFPRWLNHFYDPTTGLGLLNGKSSLQWAKDSSNNEWDWTRARYSYYSALTSTQTSARSTWFAHLFRGLGQIMHLIQDKAVPAHVRNDAHIPVLNSQRDMYERYTSNAVRGIDQNGIPIPRLNFGGYTPVELSIFNNLDTFWINGGKGLAEYTNRNFLSRNTNIDDAMYALPAPIGDWTTTETAGSNQYTVKYLQGYATDNYRFSESKPISRLSAYSYMDFEMNKYGYTQRVYSLNDKIHKEYADLLVPRAVGYSAGLLNYFFRGSIEITVPSNGVYSMIDATQPGFDPSSATFTGIKLRAKNTTPNEDMTDGSIQLVVKYKVAQDDPFQGGPVATTPDFSYIVVPEKNNIRVLSRTAATELNFDLSQTPMPIRATDVYLQIVYHGKLGNEDGAVAVGFKDIGEPTPLDLLNNMDKICLYSTWYDAGSPDAIAQVDTNQDGIANERDVYAHDATNIYIRLMPTNVFQLASASVNNYSVSSLPAGQFMRATYILSDYNFNFSFYNSFTATDSNDIRAHYDNYNRWASSSIRRQTDFTEDSGQCSGAPSCYINNYPNFWLIRGFHSWAGGSLIWDMIPYPSNSQCLYADIN